MLYSPNAKINLGLHIVERRPDGYHNLETVFYPIPLSDELCVEELSLSDHPGKDYLFINNGTKIDSTDEANLVVKAYRLLQGDFNFPFRPAISLLKQIPFGAGLGGGSSDAAFMLKALNQLYDLQLNDDQLSTYASKLGADCAFFIYNQPLFARGIGNEFSEIELSLKGYYLVLVKPNIHVSTAQAYAHVKPGKPQHDLRESLLQPIESWRERVQNDFELSVFPTDPRIAAIKQSLYDQGAIYASMSGSGASVFGIFDHLPTELQGFEKDFVFTSSF